MGNACTGSRDKSSKSSKAKMFVAKKTASCDSLSEETKMLNALYMQQFLKRTRKAEAVLHSVEKGMEVEFFDSFSSEWKSGTVTYVDKKDKTIVLSETASGKQIIVPPSRFDNINLK